MIKQIFTLCAIFTLLFSCQDSNSDLEEFQNKSVSFEEFFEKISKKDIQIGKEKVLLINYEWNSKEKTIKLINTEEVEPSWGLAFDIAEGKKTLNRGEKVYTVSCDKGGKKGNGWKKTCNGKFSCGRLAYSCLEIGGCATICKSPMIYVPETKEFYIPSDGDITKLIELP